ncbi:di-heme oxidoredictase family protein [Hwanghaeella sp.]|uniref:di-heme oxidoreductase family protein n=1 Tax=Hwanghaeella sp. TaxID=2605943 RepID=UPI003CCBFDEE
MERYSLIVAVFLLLAGVAPAKAQETYLRSLPGVDLDGTPELREGRRLFNLHFLDRPVGEEAGGGLGPHFNRNACSTCHPRGGRGSAPNGPDEPLLTALVRLSVSGTAANGGPLPHPRYGGQLNTRGIRDVLPEAEVSVSYEVVQGTYGDGTAYVLRRPQLSFFELAYGPLDDALTSFRIGQPIYGLGLLEAVPVDEIRSWADPDDRDGDGVSGRMNNVWGGSLETAVPGRFGWKANEPDLVQQTAAAFLGDIGITSNYFPEHDCGAGQEVCRAADAQGPEVDRAVQLVAGYLRTIAPPARRDAVSIRRGEALFDEAGCAKCHRPTLGLTASDKAYLNGVQVDAYTDLLLHDMGEGLADGRPDFEAIGREWRTPPLWGIGLAETVHGRFALLHDGRARSLEEAILWHGGEGETAREAFRTMAVGDRAALVAFLKSL